ncbi:MAG TPA: DNA polymerase Y family protein [Usitatibacter sp.]|nr:DNA polymerase Y family protein [Usitatibacter sp.]
MLWVALELPALPLQIVEQGGVCSVPLVVSEGSAQRSVVACMNAAAKDAGIREGQAVAAAKALAGELRIVARDPAIEREAVERLAAWATQFTPISCIDGQGVVLEVASTLRLFDGHAKLAAAIRKGVRELGFHASLGIAPTPLAARTIARAAVRGLQVRSCLAPEDLVERLSDLPLFLFDWPGKTLAQLADLGILRIRDALALSQEGLARRFGSGTATFLDRLLGRLPDPRTPYVAPPRFRSRLELPAEADGVEALLFALRRMLAEFEGAMRGRGAGVQRLLLSLEHGRKARTRVPLEFSSTEREAEFILAIAREKLGRLTLSAPTRALELRAEALLAYVPRESTWLPGAKEQAVDRGRLMERLAARLGRQRVFGIAVAEDHRPEKNWGSDPFSRGAEQKQKRAPSCSCPREKGSDPKLRPAWLLHRPQKLIVEGDAPQLQGGLEMLAGPERIEAGWWDGEEVSRDYYVAANPQGETFWVFREHHGAQAWYLHGVFA